MATLQVSAEMSGDEHGASLSDLQQNAVQLNLVDAKLSDEVANLRQRVVKLEALLQSLVGALPTVVADRVSSEYLSEGDEPRGKSVFITNG